MIETTWLCGACACLAVGIPLLAVIGHGIWVLSAALFRQVFKKRQPPAVCPNCGAPLSGVPCVRCGWPRMAEVNELLAALKQVNALRDAGLIDAATAAKVTKAIQAKSAGLQPVRATPVESLQKMATAAPPEQALQEMATQPAPAEKVVETVPVIPIPPRIPPQAVTASPPRPPRKSLSEVMASFMEERNIRWGELIGGLLIVGCSIALVVSLWSQIAQRPFLKFSIFTAVTASLLGIGLYTEHRWKLPMTSRGILLIAALLVPLNFLASAAFSEGGPVGDPIAVGSEVVSFGLFLALLWMGSKVLAPTWPGLLTGGVLGSSAILVAIRYLSAGQWGTALTLGAMPVACYLGVMGMTWPRARRWTTVGAAETNALLLLLGVVSFAALLPFCLVIYKAQAITATFRTIAPLISLWGVPSLCIGLWLWVKLKDAKLGGIRTAGTAVAIAGALVMMAGMGAAWPRPGSAVPVALIDFAVLATVAVVFEIPAGHLLAGLCLVVAYLLGFHGLSGHVAWGETDTHRVVGAIMGQSTGPALTTLFVAIGGACIALVRRGRQAEARFYGMVAGVVALGCVALVSWQTYGTHAHLAAAPWMYVVYALSAFAGAWALRWPKLAFAGWALLLPAFEQWTDSWALALLIDATLAAAVQSLNTAAIRDLLGTPARIVCIGTSLLGAVLVLVKLSDHSYPWCSAAGLRMGWIAALWLTVVLTTEWAWLFVMFQAVLSLAVILGVIGQLQGRPWFPCHDVLLHPWVVQALAVAVAIVNLLFAIARNTLRDNCLARMLRPVMSLDRLMSIALVLTLLVLATVTVVPGIGVEFATSVTASEGIGGYEHVMAGQWGSWALLGVLLAVLAMEIRQGLMPWALVGIVIVAFAACPLGAATWEGKGATASAFRWYAAIYLLGLSAVIWTRGKLLPANWEPRNLRPTRITLLSLAVPAILLLTIYPALQAFDGRNVLGPVRNCFFGRLGNSLSYVIPLLMLTSALVGHALRQRSSAYAFAAGLVLNLTVSLGYALAHLAGGFGQEQILQLAQLNAVASAGYAIAWLAIRGRVFDHTDRLPALLHIQALIAVVIIAPLILGGELHVFLSPSWNPEAMAVLGQPWGWGSLILTGVAAALIWRLWQPHRALTGTTLALLAVAPMASFSCYALGWMPWTGFHGLLAAYGIAAWLMLAVGWHLARQPDEPVMAAFHVESPATTGNSPVALGYHHPTGISDVISADQLRRQSTAAVSIWLLLWATVAIGLRGALNDPARPWWSAGAIFAMAMLAITVACWRLLRRYLYAAGFLLNLAATIFWLNQYWQWGTNSFVDLLNVNILVLAIPALAWLVLELQVFRKLATSRDWPAFHHVAGILATLMVGGCVALGLVADADGDPLRCTVPIAWGALVTVVVLMLGCLWDSAARYAIAGMYALGLVAVGLTVDQFDLPVETMAWLGAVVLGMYTLLSSWLFSLRPTLADAMSRLGIPERGQAATAWWLVPANLCLAVVIMAIGFGADFHYRELSLRLSVAVAALAQAVAIGLLARGDMRWRLQKTSLWAAAVGIVITAWALLSPDAELLNRLVVLMGALAGTTVLYGLGLGKLLKREKEWTNAARSVVPGLAVFTFVSLLLILGDEVWCQINMGAVSMNPWAIAVVLVAIVGLAAAGITLAVVPGRDPLKLSERGRMGYVYAAELLLGLAFMHVRLTKPEWFSGMFLRYWPLIVMAIAFAGVGLSELFRRRNRLVLSEPLERTGIFLPLLPVIGYWAIDCRVDYSAVLVIIGILYGALSVMRRSFGFGLLAALASNGGLWYFLHRIEGFGLLNHPQLWMIPAALCVLAAAYLNRQQLSETQMQAIRYICLMLIYVSSTADMFLNGVAQAPWLPVVLAGLSVAGVLAGIVLRIRAFLFLGTGFLLLSLITIIYHASVNLHQTWLIWVSGIGLGVGIIALFAVFEKKRNEVVAMVEKLKTWHA